MRWELAPAIKTQIETILGEGAAPTHAVVTRHYDQSLKFEYDPPIEAAGLSAEPVIAALSAFAKAARRLPSTAPEQEEKTAAQRTTLAGWATGWQDKLKGNTDLRGAAGTSLLTTLKTESDSKSSPATAEMVEKLQEVVDPTLDESKLPPKRKRIDDLVQKELPVFIYFENYGILDSAIWLPRFLEDLAREATSPRVRTINAMFKHVGLDPKDVTTLGDEQAKQMRASGQNVSPDVIAKDQRKKEERAIRLNSASNDITTRFSAWWSQRRHKIRYHADGDYFRIWIADDRRPDVEIELESRSKGFQWFFSFYLVFLVESEDGHKRAMLLLDEPGVHLHPTAQQELISFFETLAKKNQLVYTTHSPFLIDGEHLHRIRPVTEDATGHSRVNKDSETWPHDRETIFPLQAAAGYAMVRGLFQHRQNVLVEGMTDYYYLQALSEQCRAKGMQALPADVYVTPCGGTKLVGQIAALFLGQKVRPLVLLDGDDAGRVRQTALLNELYASHGSAIVMLDDALGKPGEDVEVEDIIGEKILLHGVKSALGIALTLTTDDRKAGSLPDQLKAAAARAGKTLPEGWKATVAIALVSEWAEKKTQLPDSVLDAAAKLFSVLAERFSALK